MNDLSNTTLVNQCESRAMDVSNQISGCVYVCDPCEYEYQGTHESVRTRESVRILWPL